MANNFFVGLKRCAFRVFFIIFLISKCLYADDLSFVVIADNRDYTTQFRAVLQEINEMTLNPAPAIPYPLFLVGNGDIDPVESNMAIYNDRITYPNLPSFYPVVGNHEIETDSDMKYILDSMIPYLEKVVNNGKQGTYSFDYKNIHCVVLDQYSTNRYGEVDVNLQAWLQQDLNATKQDHVFVFGHEPAFPRRRHVGDSLDQFPESRNAFWNILVKDSRVLAYFCGHTHNYYRMRVKDPTSAGTSGYPDQDGGVYQVDCGAAGNLDDGNLTIVYVHVQDDSVRFRAIASSRTDVNWGMKDQWSISGTKRFGMQLITPQTGSVVSGDMDIIWSFSESHTEPLTTTIYVSNDAGTDWDTLWTAQTEATTYTWNTTDNPDGTKYMLRVVCKSDSGFGMVQTNEAFTINNPGNAIPEIELIKPTKGDTLSGEYNIEWNAVDADGDQLLISLEISVDGGSNWLPLTSDEPNDGIFSWNTLLWINTSKCRVKLKCTDGTAWAEEVSGALVIENERQALPDTIFQHISGTGGGLITAQVIFPDELTEHRYRITFDDTTLDKKTYDIYDLETVSFVVDDAAEMDGKTEGPLFDGIRLVMYDYKKPVVDYDNKGWTVGACNLSSSISLPAGGIAYPADYQIMFYDQIVDTSSSVFGDPEVCLFFKVWNLTEDRQVDVIFIDGDNNQTVSRYDKITILEKDKNGQPIQTWKIYFSGTSASITPVAGDVFTFKTLKPFTNKDVYEFYATFTGIASDGTHPVPSEFRLEQNYPNPFNLKTAIRYQLPAAGPVTITIYNTLGQEVRTLVDGHKKAGYHIIQWDGRDKDGYNLSSGVYLYQMIAGSHIQMKKLLLLK